MVLEVCQDTAVDCHGWHWKGKACQKSNPESEFSLLTGLPFLASFCFILLGNDKECGYVEYYSTPSNGLGFLKAE